VFQGLVGFIGPVGEAGLAGEKVKRNHVPPVNFVLDVFTR